MVIDGCNNTLAINHIGEVSCTKRGTKATIVDYKNNKKVLVEFCDSHKYRYWTSYINFINKRLTNPYECRFSNGIGYIGVGEYNSKDHVLAYSKWKAIISRCYHPLQSKKTESYENCDMCEEWNNFQTFAKWFYENWYECDEPLCVDKDIIYHNNKIYSPETCLLVPRRINLLFIKEKKRRGNTPIGVQTHKDKIGYSSSVSTSDGYKYLGYFYDTQSAFLAYKEAKEKYIKQVADSYKGTIPNSIYEILQKI